MESSTFTTNMWAIINKDNIVIDYSMEVSDEETSKNNNVFIKMTPENSPAFIGAYYNGSKFVEKETL